MGIGTEAKNVSPWQQSRKSKKPERTVKTAEEAAIEARQRSLLDDEIEESEKRFKALARGRSSPGSLLGATKAKGSVAKTGTILPSASSGAGGGLAAGPNSGKL